MQDGYNEHRPRHRRRKRINWTGVFFWLVVLMALIAVIVLLVKPGRTSQPQLPTETQESTPQQGQPDRPQQETEATLPIVPETSAPTEAPTAPPTEPPTEAPTEPPTEAPTEAPTSPPTEATAGVDDPESYGSVAELAVAVAQSALGMPYEYGGSGPGTFDTSGLIYYCFKESGVGAPRLVSEQVNFGTAVEKDDLKPGDVVFFYTDTPGKAEYVGIYIGGDSFIAARSSIGAIGQLSMNSSYFAERFVCARRYA